MMKSNTTTATDGEASHRSNNGLNGFEMGSDADIDFLSLTCERGPSPGDGTDATNLDCDGRFDVGDVLALFVERQAI